MRRLQLADEPELLKPLRERLAITKRRRKHRAAGKRLRAAMEKAAELKEALALVKDAEENKGFPIGLLLRTTTARVARMKCLCVVFAESKSREWYA